MHISNSLLTRDFPFAQTGGNCALLRPRKTSYFSPFLRRNGKPKPELETKLIFFHRFGVLDRELWGKDKMFRGAVAPQFFMSNGSEARVSHVYQHAVFKMTEAVTCTKCKHQHLLEPPSLEMSVADLESVKVSAAVA